MWLRFPAPSRSRSGWAHAYKTLLSAVQDRPGAGGLSGQPWEADPTVRRICDSEPPEQGSAVRPGRAQGPVCRPKPAATAPARDAVAVRQDRPEPARSSPAVGFGTAWPQTEHQTAYRTVKAPDAPPLGQQAQAPGAKKPGVSRITSRVYPTCAPIKKPISGKPEIGAQFVSFNFTNNLICTGASSQRNALPEVFTIPRFSGRSDKDDRVSSRPSPRWAALLRRVTKQRPVASATACGRRAPSLASLSHRRGAVQPGSLVNNNKNRPCLRSGSWFAEARRRAHKKPDLGQARHRGTVREFQFHE